MAEHDAKIKDGGKEEPRKDKEISDSEKKELNVAFNVKKPKTKSTADTSWYNTFTQLILSYENL